MAALEVVGAIVTIVVGLGAILWALGVLDVSMDVRRGE